MLQRPSFETTDEKMDMYQIAPIFILKHESRDMGVSPDFRNIKTKHNIYYQTLCGDESFHK